MMHLNRHDEPFKSIQAAKVGAMHLKKNKDLDSKPVEIEGGFGLQVEEALETEEKPRKAKRTRIGTRNVLKREAREGYVGRYVNIDPEKAGWDRIRTFLNAGYQIGPGDAPIEDKRISDISNMGNADIRSVGGGIKAIWMEIQEDWYDEDRAEDQAEIDERENDMRVNENNPGEGNYGHVAIT